MDISITFTGHVYIPVESVEMSTALEETSPEGLAFRRPTLQQLARKQIVEWFKHSAKSKRKNVQNRAV